MQYSTSAGGEKPRLFRLTQCDFPFVEVVAGGRTVLLLPQRLRKIFVESKVHLIRVDSLLLAQKLPNFGSEASGQYSFLPHKDNFGDDTDPKRYLVLSKATSGARGSSTLVCTNEIAMQMLPLEESYFHRERVSLGNERSYNPKFQIAEEDYHRCFDERQGYGVVVGQVCARVQGRIPETTVRLNILNYLIRGLGVEPLMQNLMRTFRDACTEENWEDGGVLIIDNAAVFHLRFGNNAIPPKRNFCV